MARSQRGLEGGALTGGLCLLALVGCGVPGDDPSSCAPGELEIAQLQGNGAISAHSGEWLSIAGVVSVSPARLGSTAGFFLQADDASRPPRAAGVFVALEGPSPPAAGERVRVRGRVEEIGGVTALTSLELVEPCGRAGLAPLALDPDPAEAERWEGVWIRSTRDWTLVDTSELESRGTLGVSARGRPYAPGHPLGDVRLASYWTLTGQQEAARTWLSAGTLSEHLRLGARASELAGVVLAGPEPTLLMTQSADFRAPSAAPLPRRAPGSLRVAALNLDNYFVELGARGARSQLELSRQRSKLVAALRQLDADILALSELGSPPPRSDAAALANPSLADLISALDAELPSELAYQVSEAPAPEAGVLRSAIAYRGNRLRPNGPCWFMDAAEFRRAPVFQSFEIQGRELTLGVLHLKSKSCNGAEEIVGPEGCGADVRAQEARALTTRLRELPASDSENLLLIGDFNSDVGETPLLELKSAGFLDCFDAVPPEQRYTYVFDGRATQLDHALAGATLRRSLAGAHIWHINADEPELFDYRLEHPPEAFQPDARRCSDHDPILVDFAL